jgi:hypothetical protein
LVTSHVHQATTGIQQHPAASSSISLTKYPIQCAFYKHIVKNHRPGLNNQLAKDTSSHFVTIHNPTDPKAIIASIPTINLPRISNASLISSFATFLIFLFRCHDLLFLEPLSFGSLCFGLIASLGSTCVLCPLRHHLESSGSWYGSGSSQLDG